MNEMVKYRQLSIVIRDSILKLTIPVNVIHVIPIILCS